MYSCSPSSNQLRVIILRLELVEIAEPVVYSFFGRVAGGVDAAERPLAVKRRAISGALENLRESQVLRLERNRRGAIGTNARVARVHARHEGASGGSALCIAGISAREADAFARELIDTRSGDLLLPVAAEIAITQIVGKDEQDVGPRTLRTLGKGRRGERQRAQEFATTQVHGCL